MPIVAFMPCDKCKTITECESSDEGMLCVHCLEESKESKTEGRA